MIAQTLAENSLKLISLKGLLEYEITHNARADKSATDESATELSDTALEIMALMDGLL